MPFRSWKFQDRTWKSQDRRVASQGRCWAGRARELAEAAAISLSTVQRFEGEQTETIALARKAIAAAFEAHGVEFIEGGARLKPKPSRKK
jgi:hypothetical protein